LTSLATGDASSRLVEAYRLHPKAIKALARCGQGYLLSDAGLAPVAYGMLPPLTADYSLPRKEQKAARWRLGMARVELRNEALDCRVVGEAGG